MTNTRSLIVAMALALVAVPAAADSPRSQPASDGFIHIGGESGWELAQPRYFGSDPSSPAMRVPDGATSAPAPSPAVPGDFEFVGGERGWQLVPQAYAWREGRFVKTGPVRAGIEAPAKVTARDVEEMARLYTGG